MVDKLESVTVGDAKKSAFRTLRALFLAGYVMNIILWFVPAVRMKVGGFAGTGGEEQLFSTFSLVRLLSQEGAAGITLLFVVIFASNIAFIALTLSVGRRWVFITGSSFAAFFILLGVFSAPSEEISYLLVPRVLGWTASLLTLLGFFINPPTSGVRQVVQA